MFCPDQNLGWSFFGYLCTLSIFAVKFEPQKCKERKGISNVKRDKALAFAFHENAEFAETFVPLAHKLFCRSFGQLFQLIP